MRKEILKDKGDVLGEVGKPKPVGEFYVTNEMVATPLRYEGCVVRGFCLGCGESTELIPEGGMRLAELAGVQVPETWQGCYFESERCIVCDEDYQGVVLKKVG